jgi:hypothetical protein
MWEQAVEEEQVWEHVSKELVVVSEQIDEQQVVEHVYEQV